MTDSRIDLASLTSDQRQDLLAQLRRQRDEARAEARPEVDGPDRLSLYFFPTTGTVSESDYFSMVFDACKVADAAGFHAAWFPERHFVAFGGQHPNPSVMAAAVAACTTRLQVRAGSVAAPLHHVIRVAEEWALVDRISRGRAGLSLASGWHRDDFVLSDVDYDRRREHTISCVETIRGLWAGESRAFVDSDGQEREVALGVSPSQELPMWLTAAGSPSTFEAAARARCGVMTAMLGQSLPAMTKNIARYRQTWQDCGHPGRGDVVAMVHTYVSDEPDLEHVLRPAMHSYLSDFLQQTSTQESDQTVLLEAAFQEYLRGPSLLGSTAKARGVLGELSLADVDEVGCLVDFGLPAATVLAGLESLGSLLPERRTSGI